MSFIFLIRKFLASVMTLFMFIGVKPVADTHTVKDAENCLVNFTVMSDIHIEGNNPERYIAFARILQDAKNNTNDNDAIVFCGDNTMNGQHIESMLLFGMLKKISPADKILLGMGNHDVGNGEGDYEELRDRFLTYNNGYFNNNRTQAYFSEDVGGYRFIFISSEAHTINDIAISEEQLTWLDAELAAATADGKPVFVFSHYPYNYYDNYTQLSEILLSYNNVFYICGHTHMSLCSYSFWDEGSFHYINLPRVTELSGSGDDIAGDYTGVGIEVEIYNDSVVIRARNYYKSIWLEDYEYSYEIV